MKILLLGAAGQVGSELQRSLAPLGQLITLTRKECDLTDLNTLAQQLNQIKPDIIVNAAAYTKVDRAENETDLAAQINTYLPAALAQWTAAHDKWLIHYSTDYVFDGKKTTPYDEEDMVSPLNIYGKTKAAGEAAINAAQSKHLIFRTSWVYGFYGQNFAKTILQLAQKKDAIKVVGDQVGVPTSAELIADVTALILYRLKMNENTIKSGIYHLVPSGVSNWHEFACYLTRNMSCTIEKITSKEYHTKALRPMNSLLNTQKLLNQFNIMLPPWQQYVDRFLAQYPIGIMQ